MYKIKGILLVSALSLCAGTTVQAQLDETTICSPFDDGYLVGDDWDGDGVLDAEDDCAEYYDPNNDDLDGDLVGDVCDNCPLVYNPTGNDVDMDGIGDACDDDIDGDLVLNPRGYQVVTETDTADSDSDSDSDTDTDTGDTDTATDSGADDTESDTADTEADTSSDSDTEAMSVYYAIIDNCPMAYNPDQADLDGDGLGDACDSDLDGDGAENDVDFCPFDRNVKTYVTVLSYSTESCLGNTDGDSILNYQVVNGVLSALDNCPFMTNEDQADLDGDGVGDVCDPDADGDEIPDDRDNCLKENLADTIEAFNNETPGEDSDIHMEDWTNQQWLSYVANTDQVDIDKDRVGDLCDLDFSSPTATGYAFDNCYVVLDDADNCLKVGDDALQVYSPAVIASKTSDDPIRLRIFANKPNTPLSYSWTLVAGDADGIELEHASGVVRCSNAYEYHYSVKAMPVEGSDEPDVEDFSATYETRLSGNYTLRLRVVQLDDAGSPMTGEENISETYVVINSSGTDDYIADSCGCAAVGHSSTHPLSFMLFLLAALVVLKRRFIQ